MPVYACVRSIEEEEDEEEEEEEEGEHKHAHKRDGIVVMNIAVVSISRPLVYLWTYKRIQCVVHTHISRASAGNVCVCVRARAYLEFEFDVRVGLAHILEEHERPFHMFRCITHVMRAREQQSRALHAHSRLFSRRQHRRRFRSMSRISFPLSFFPPHDRRTRRSLQSRIQAPQCRDPAPISSSSSSSSIFFYISTDVIEFLSYTDERPRSP